MMSARGIEEQTLCLIIRRLSLGTEQTFVSVFRPREDGNHKYAICLRLLFTEPGGGGCKLTETRARDWRRKTESCYVDLGQCRDQISCCQKPGCEVREKKKDRRVL